MLSSFGISLGITACVVFPDSDEMTKNKLAAVKFKISFGYFLILGGRRVY